MASTKEFLCDIIFLINIALCVSGFVLESKVDLPTPDLSQLFANSKSIDEKAAINPTIVKALYEVYFKVKPYRSDHTRRSTSDNEEEEGIVQLIGSHSERQPCLGNKFPCYQLISNSDSPNLIKVEEFLTNLVKNDRDEVPIVTGFDPGQGVAADKRNRTIRDQADNKVNLQTSTSVPTSTSRLSERDDGTVPVYKGTVDTQSVLNKEEPKRNFLTTTRRPNVQVLPERPVRPWIPPSSFNYNINDQRQNTYNGPRYYGDRPCLVPPCPYQQNYSPYIRNV